MVFQDQIASLAFITKTEQLDFDIENNSNGIGVKINVCLILTDGVKKGVKGVGPFGGKTLCKSNMTKEEPKLN